MVKRLKVGIVGCGAIGSSLAKRIIKDFSQSIALVALYDSDAARSREVSRVVSPRKNLAVKNLAQAIQSSELIIEAASAASSWKIASSALRKGRRIMIMSVGGIVPHRKALYALAKTHNAKVYIPSGAIAGIDALKASKFGTLKKVTLTTRKPPGSFKGVAFVEKKKIPLEALTKDTVLFSGKASKAMRLFPQNINVAGVLSLAGCGQEKTEVRIIASPSLRKNTHEIEIQSEAGSVWTRTENTAHPDNPKTSYLAVLSAVATLQQVVEPVEIGT